MTTFYDVPAEDLIEAVAERLEDELEPPEWIEFAKSASSKEHAPEQDNFWSLRAASLLRKVAVKGPIGVQRLKTSYGGAKGGTNRYRVKPASKTEGSGNIIRTALQQLEDAGYVDSHEGRGRTVTGEGRSLLDQTAEELIEELDRPELDRYA